MLNHDPSYARWRTRDSVIGERSFQRRGCAAVELETGTACGFRLWPGSDRTQCSHSLHHAMIQNAPIHRSDICGASCVAIDAIVGMAHLVEAMHVNIARLQGVPRPAVPVPARGITGLVHGSVRLVAGRVGRVLDAALARLVPLHGADIILAPTRRGLSRGQWRAGRISCRYQQPVGDSDAAGARRAPAPRLMVLVHGLLAQGAAQESRLSAVETMGRDGHGPSRAAGACRSLASDPVLDFGAARKLPAMVAAG